MSFVKGQSYAGAAIVEELGAEKGKPYYALHREGRVLAFALNRWQNPGAPAEIIVGCGESREQYADTFIEHRPDVPVFIKEQKQDTGWIFAGTFRLRAASNDPAEKNKRVQPPAIPSVYKILFLQEVEP